MKRLILIVALALLGCRTNQTEERKLQLALIGSTTGGMEKTWKFQSLDQFKSFKIIGRDPLVVDMVMKDRGSSHSFRIVARPILQSDGSVDSVGLIYIEQIK